MRRAALRLLSILLLLTAAPALAQSTTRPAIRPTTLPTGGHRVLVVSIDGLRPDVALRADMPNLRSLMRRGAYTFWAYTTPMAVTLPSHTSMLTGVTIERHKVDWNDERAVGKPVYPAAPTLFQVAHENGLTTALVAGKAKFDVFDTPETLDYKWIAREKVVPDRVVADRACRIIADDRPEVMFVHLPGVDTAGHAKGWGSPEQVRAVETADDSLGRVLKALDDAGLTDQTDIIVSSDHGGSGIAHGPNDDRSAHIPWVAAGPGIRKDYDLTLDRGLKVYTYDTFATALALAGIRPPEGIDGKVITDIRPLPTAGSELMGTTNAPATRPDPIGSVSNADPAVVPYSFEALPLNHVPDDCPICRALRGQTMPDVQR